MLAVDDTDVGALFCMSDRHGTHMLLVKAVTRHGFKCIVVVIGGYVDYDGPLVYDHESVSRYLDDSYVRLA